MNMEILLALYLIAAGVLDLRGRRVDNRFIFTGLMAGLFFRTAGEGSPGLVTGLAGMALGSMSIVLYILKGMGAGDVKLLMVSGCFLGPSGLVDMFVYTVFAAAALLPFFLVMEAASRQRAGPCGLYGRCVMPMAPDMFLGTVLMI